MKKSVLRVTIAGQPGSGKTTLAREIQQLLKSAGLVVENQDPDPTPPMQNLQYVFESLKERRIVIQTKSVRQAPKV